MQNKIKRGENHFIPHKQLSVATGLSVRSVSAIRNGKLNDVRGVEEAEKKITDFIHDLAKSSSEKSR